MLVGTMDSHELALHCAEAAADKKAEDIVILDLRGVSSITDFFVIASGTSDPHLKAVVESIVDRLRDDDARKPQASDGFRTTHWAVLDYYDVIVHVMTPDIRARYDLEGLWGDAPRVPLPNPAQGTEAARAL